MKNLSDWDSEIVEKWRENRSEVEEKIKNDLKTKENQGKAKTQQLINILKRLKGIKLIQIIKIYFK